MTEPNLSRELSLRHCRSRQEGVAVTHELAAAYVQAVDVVPLMLRGITRDDATHYQRRARDEYREMWCRLAGLLGVRE